MWLALAPVAAVASEVTCSRVLIQGKATQSVVSRAIRVNASDVRWADYE